MKTSTKMFLILISLGLLMAVYFFAKRDISQKSFYQRAMEDTKNESYQGIIIKKFYAHGRYKILLKLDSTAMEMDFVYEAPGLYEYLKIGDSIVKMEGLLEVKVIRKKNDTVFPLRFQNISK